MQNKTLVYDGTFDGFLSAVFYVFEHKLEDVYLQNQFSSTERMFSEKEEILTENVKADRVWKGIQNKLGKSQSYKLYYAFLSEKNGVEDVLLNMIKYIFSDIPNVANDFSQASVLEISKIAKMVGREKHRMEAFVRFKLTKDGIYFSNIEPDFNVLPLISSHFKKRYADQKWLIYDIKRRFGLFYDLDKVDTITLYFPDDFDFTKTDENIFANQEFEFQKLWQDYFKSVNITSRKNMKLHIQHVPKRYWKYMSEKLN
ncbi:TIGR03915 family putative DNA repair protein [Sediminibacter sp. Hel_I_10]|uniref:TIGR03915 family putative DNA repair protein n=1 Tax=Sediminibacter sp. Hel_I_10 TaxID=1392490 RepID=UPI00047E1994|nr:TIGR03915 family putative DNA repair protein [Sediminibacter sp. Hel_I_10]